MCARSGRPVTQDSSTSLTLTLVGFVFSYHNQSVYCFSSPQNARFRTMKSLPAQGHCLFDVIVAQTFFRRFLRRGATILVVVP